MRGLRILALVAAIAVAIVAWRDYQQGQARLAMEAAEAPAAIAEDIASQSAGWSWSQSSAGRQRVSISAGGFRQDRKRSSIELIDVRLEIQHPESGVYDRITTAVATFDSSQSRFYSEGRVVVTLGLPTGETLADESAYTRIITSGATFNTETGEAWTDQPTEYEFDGGKGSSTGARYDSLNRRFTMSSDARIERFPSSPGGVLTVIQAGRLDYYEVKEQIHLAGGCSLEQGSYRVSAESADIFLDEGAIREIVATTAIGTSRDASRETQFETPFLRVLYSVEGWVERVLGEGRSRLSSMSATSQMSAEGDWIQLRYAAAPGELDSRLTDGDVVGAARIEASQRGAKDGVGDRTVESESIHLKMRPTGDEVAYLETTRRGRILISPDGNPGASETRLAGDMLRVDYAAGNRMEKLTATGSVELTDTPQADGELPLKSWSESLEARFDPVTEDLISLKQGGGTRFVQDTQRGSGADSVYEPLLGRLTLTGSARVDQPGVVITADEIILVEASGQLQALGNVAARYQDDAPSTGSEGMFADGEPVFAAADRMTAGEQKGRIVYEGRARLWQNENRVEAERIVVDQVAETLEATGDVRSTLRGPGTGAAPTLVYSETLLYREETRTAAYRGGVLLSRDALRVRAAELDANLTGDSGAELESAVARGDVEIVQLDSGRKGFGSSARYETASEQVVLLGDPARAENARGEETRGARLTYRIDHEALLVEGAAEPAYSVQRQAKN